MDRPNFLILGVNKCGTTSLFRWLDLHPQVFLSEPKEPHFFIAESEKGLDSYWRTYFSGWSGQPAVGEATAAYATLPFVAPLLARDLPDARFIVCLRNPVDRAHSAWWMHVTRGVEPLSFPEAIAENQARLDEGRTFEGPAGQALWRRGMLGPQRGRRAGAIEHRVYLDGGHYADNLAHYLRHFPRDRFHFVLLEDMRKDPTGVLAGVERFLGVDPHAFPDPLPAENPALGARATGWFRAFNATRATRILHLMPGPVRRLGRRVMSGGGRPAMDAATRARLVAHFREHNRRLEPLLGRDLSSWDR